jgi:hypothetical protein
MSTDPISANCTLAEFESAVASANELVFRTATFVKGYTSTTYMRDNNMTFERNTRRVAITLGGSDVKILHVSRLRICPSQRVRNDPSRKNGFLSP